MANKDTTTLTMELTCTMCKVKPSSGQHYGVKICEADKQFLKRTFHYQLKYPPCTKEGGGVCPPRPRGWCQLCRLRTCLATPVNIAMIRVGDKYGDGKVKKSIKEKNLGELDHDTYQVTIPLTQEFQMPEYYSFAATDWSPSVPPPLACEYYPTTTAPSFYDVPAFYRASQQPYDYSNLAHVSCKEDKFLNTHQEVSTDFECVPLDLSLKTKAALDDDQWFTDELSFAEFPTKLLFRQPKEEIEEPLDLTTTSGSACLSKSSAIGSSRPSSPFCLGFDYLRSTVSRPSSADGRIRSTPSPVLEASYGLNKLSVNSTVLGDALSQIQANISVSSLANLSSVSDILADGNK